MNREYIQLSLAVRFCAEMVSSIQPSMCRYSLSQNLLISKRWFSTVCLSLLTLM